MLARRLAISSALAIALVPASDALAAEKTGRPHVPEAPATRGDVLAGRASNAQQLELLKSSIEAAGGTAVDDPTEVGVSGGSAAIGGSAYPLTAADLDGDGDQELILLQYLNKAYVIAADDSGVLWRQKLPKDSSIAGFLTEDLSSSLGQDLVLVMRNWASPPPFGGEQTSFGVLGQHGLRWTFKADVGWLEINGAVQADDDEQSELAFTFWSDYGEPEIQTLDGESGTQISWLRPTLEERLPPDVDFSSEAFVTDGTDGQADEAVFVTRLTGAGYYAERRSLIDGTQTDYEIVQSFTPDLTQGPDYTGDGRRDAFAHLGETGVFDPVTLSTRWTQENGQDTVWTDPYSPGDLNSDGASELCLILDEMTWDQEDEAPSEYRTRVKCHSGSDGALLWEHSLSVAVPTGGDYNPAWVSPNVRSDLDGDGVVDPVLGAQSDRCYEDENFTCETISFEAVAFNGIGGAPLWSVNDLSEKNMLWTLSAVDIDGVAGDDFLDDSFYDEDAPSFVVRNGLTLQNSWEGHIRPGTYGWTQGVGEADVDGDGTQEAAVTARVSGQFCHPRGCRYESRTYLSVFEPGADLLWQVEL